MYFKKVLLFIVAPALLLALVSTATNSGAIINGMQKADSFQTITFPQITGADTLETVQVTGVRSEIEFQIKLVSTRHAGWTAGTDSVYFQLAKSLDDSNYVNVSATGETKKWGAAGTYTVNYDLLKSTHFLQGMFPRVAGDSIRIQVKALVSPRE